MARNVDEGSATAPVPTAEWHAAGWDAPVALAAVIVLMIGAPVAIVVVLACGVVYAAARRDRSRRG